MFPGTQIMSQANIALIVKRFDEETQQDSFSDTLRSMPGCNLFIASSMDDCFEGCIFNAI